MFLWVRWLKDGELRAKRFAFRSKRTLHISGRILEEGLGYRILDRNRGIHLEVGEAVKDLEEAISKFLKYEGGELVSWRVDRERVDRFRAHHLSARLGRTFTPRTGA